ncbi:MAG: hypothetical protein L0Z53_05490 [Acidobacteriales bacterium]|nr:hypothetical protein [Terriglobales bacterium]
MKSWALLLLISLLALVTSAQQVEMPKEKKYKITRNPGAYITPERLEALRSVLNYLPAPHGPERVHIMSPRELGNFLSEIDARHKTRNALTYIDPKTGDATTYIDQNVLDAPELDVLFHELGHINRPDVPPKQQTEDMANTMGRSIQKLWRHWYPLRKGSEEFIRGLPLEQPALVTQLEPSVPSRRGFERLKLLTL